MMTHRIGNSEVRVISGDIRESKCEVIVSSDDSRLTQGGGVSRSIACAGGDDIRRQIANLIPVDLGDVAVTTAGKLPQKYIFHAVTIDLEKSRVIDEDLQDFIVRNSVRRCFQLMSVLKLSSIAFPLVGAGVAGIPAERAGRRMAEIFAEELGQMNRGLSVELWVFGASTKLADSIFCDIAGAGKRDTGLLSSAWIDDSSSGTAGASIATSAAVRPVVAGVAAGVVGLGALLPAFAIGGAVMKHFRGKSKKKGERDLDVAKLGGNRGRPGDGSICDVFISYSREDSKEAMGSG